MLNSPPRSPEDKARSASWRGAVIELGTSDFNLLADIGGSSNRFALADSLVQEPHALSNQ